MKILMATHYFGSHQGGIELVAERLASEFAASGQEVTWIATNASLSPGQGVKFRSVSISAFNVIERKIGLPFPIPTLAALRRMRKEVRLADIVILHDCLYLTNIAAFIFARLNGIPAMIVQHIGLVPYPNRALSGLMKFANRVVTRPMLRSARQVVFISEITKRYFAAVRFKTPPAMIFNGVDTEVFRPLSAKEQKSDIRRTLGLRTDRPLMLFVGRFVEKKGLPILKQMAELAPDYTWVFAGWGPLDPEKWNATNVRVFHDLRGRELAELYRASDLFVLPSKGEGFPLVIQEALASGLQVVCAAETATADPAMSVFVHGVHLQSNDDSGSAAAFIAVINDLLHSGAIADRQARECREFALSRYSWHRASESYLELVSGLVPEPKSAPSKSWLGNSAHPERGKRADV